MFATSAAEQLHVAERVALAAGTARLAARA
jgi:hypothetical protein